MSTQTHFTPTEACTLIAYEAVSLLNTVETQLPQCVQELRTAVEAFSGIHDLGKDGEALLEWLDMEIAAAQRFVDDGVSLPNLIDMERLQTAGLRRSPCPASPEGSCRAGPDRRCR